MSSTRDRVREHRERLRRQGLRPVQIWVPDVRAPEFIAEAHRQSMTIAMSENEADDQAFVDAISVPIDTDDDLPPARVIRGEIYSAVARGAYTGKPLPVVIVQGDRFDATESVTICPFTTTVIDAPLIRIQIASSEENGLDRPSSLMVDKITTVPRSGLSERVGRLRDDEVVQLNRAMTVFLGLASSPQN